MSCERTIEPARVFFTMRFAITAGPGRFHALPRDAELGPEARRRRGRDGAAEGDEQPAGFFDHPVDALPGSHSSNAEPMAIDEPSESTSHVEL